MRVQIYYEGECFHLQCGSGMQRVAWIGRVAAQRLGCAGIWCAKEHKVGRPLEFIPGRVFSYPDEQELDQEATIVSLLDQLEVAEDEELAFKVELRDDTELHRGGARRRSDAPSREARTEQARGRCGKYQHPRSREPPPRHLLLGPARERRA